jgi:hypothetical protein
LSCYIEPKKSKAIENEKKFNVIIIHFYEF